MPMYLRVIGVLLTNISDLHSFSEVQSSFDNGNFRLIRENEFFFVRDLQDQIPIRTKPLIWYATMSFVCTLESFEIETYDASRGYFKSAQDKAVPALRVGFHRSPPQANPIGGPVWLRGAERGDMVVGSVADIVLDDYS